MGYSKGAAKIFGGTIGGQIFFLGVSKVDSGEEEEPTYYSPRLFPFPPMSELDIDHLKAFPQIINGHPLKSVHLCEEIFWAMLTMFSID